MLRKLVKLLSSQNAKLMDEEAVEAKKLLILLSVFSWCLLLMAQLIMIFRFSGDQISDAKTYLSIATELAEKGKWYPSSENLSSSYLFGNGYINFMILIMKFTKNIKVLFVFNIFFTQIILFSSLYIIKRVLNSANTASWFIIMFSFLNTFWSEVVVTRTELPFTAIAFLALALLYSDRKYTSIVSGLLLGLANWVRPLGLPFLVGAILILIYKNRSIRETVKITTAFALMIAVIGSVTYLYCGHFVYQSTTFGVNLMMSANDKADGSYMDISDVVSIPDDEEKDMNFADYDKYYIEQSVKWIIRNPVSYISQIPKKLFYLFATETYSGSSYYSNEIDTGGIEYIESVLRKLTGSSDEAFGFEDFLICFNQAWYMLIIGLFIIGIYFSFHHNAWRGFLPYYMLFIVGTGITVTVVGGARYHFPYIPILVMLAAFALNRITEKR